MPDKLSRIFSAIAIIISALTFSYTIQIWPFKAEPQLQYSVADKICIGSQPTGIVISPDVTIFNSGRGSTKIGKMSIYIRLNSPNSSSRLLLSSRTYLPLTSNADQLTYSPFLLKSGEMWNSRVFFVEYLTDDKTDRWADLNFRIAGYLQKKVQDKQKQVPYNLKDNPPFLSDDLFAQLKDQMTEQIKWLEKGEYYLLLTVMRGFDAPDGDNVLHQKGYSFRITTEQLKGLKEYQIEAHRCPSTYNEKFLYYSVSPDLKELNSNELEILKKEYDNQPKSHIL